MAEGQVSQRDAPRAAAARLNRANSPTTDGSTPRSPCSRNGPRRTTQERHDGGLTRGDALPGRLKVPHFGPARTIALARRRSLVFWRSRPTFHQPDLSQQTRMSDTASGFVPTRSTQAVPGRAFWRKLTPDRVCFASGFDSNRDRRVAALPLVSRTRSQLLLLCRSYGVHQLQPGESE